MNNPSPRQKESTIILPSFDVISSVADRGDWNNALASSTGVHASIGSSAFPTQNHDHSAPRNTHCRIRLPPFQVLDRVLGSCRDRPSRPLCLPVLGYPTDAQPHQLLLEQHAAAPSPIQNNLSVSSPLAALQKSQDIVSKPSSCSSWPSPFIGKNLTPQHDKSHLRPVFDWCNTASGSIPHTCTPKGGDSPLRDSRPFDGDGSGSGDTKQHPATQDRPAESPALTPGEMICKIDHADSHWDLWAEPANIENGRTQLRCLWPLLGTPLGVCGYQAKRQLVQRHVETKHMNFRRYVCLWDGCNQRYGQKSTFNVHIRTHTDIWLENTVTNLERGKAIILMDRLRRVGVAIAIDAYDDVGHDLLFDHP
ncbi:hypothetical protein APHAL10511_002363 [Amanita phalloides]|nr:hypothetical protein APHAL10511_002363 [Amanita phalloides]